MRSYFALLLPTLAVLISACSSLQPETTANGEEARTKCLALKEHHEELDDRLASKSPVKGRVSESDRTVAIQMTLAETHDAKPVNSLEKGQVLSKTEATERIQKLKREGRLVSYPRILTEPGKPVSFRSVVHQPILTSRESNPSTEGGASEFNTVEYLPVGTLVGAKPTLLESGRIHLDLDLSLSEIEGTARYEGAEFPLIASSQHADSYELADGETVLLEMAPVDGDKTAVQFFATVTTVPKPE